MELGPDKIKFIEEMITALTLKRVLLLCLFATVSIIMLSAFENRASLFVKLYKTSSSTPLVSWNLSSESQNQLTKLTENPVVDGLVFLEVDLKKNQRAIKFFHIKNPDNSTEIAALVVKIARLQPLSLFDQDPKNTDQMVSMLNNEFRCVPIGETTIYKVVPDIEKRFSTICRLAVPPYFGEFLGYVMVGLSRPPSDYEFDALRIEINKISVDIYFRDITNRPLKPKS